MHLHLLSEQFRLFGCCIYLPCSLTFEPILGLDSGADLRQNFGHIPGRAGFNQVLTQWMLFDSMNKQGCISQPRTLQCRLLCAVA